MLKNASKLETAEKFKRISDPSFRRELRYNLYLIPFDLLVIFFLGQTMLPAWAALLLALVNFGTWWCYYRIPSALRTTSGQDGRSILIPGPVVENFARFIQSCGIHHRAHYGLMLAMMAGFHAAMNGEIWNQVIERHWALALSWVCYALLLLIDSQMFRVSLKTYFELREDKLTEANQYTQELRQSNEDLEQFAYIASHDLRAPLRAIGKLTDWLEEDIGHTASDSVRGNLSLLKQRILRMDMLFEDLLQYSRVGRDSIAGKDIDLYVLTLETFATLLDDKNQVLHIEDPALIVNGQPVTYTLLLSNLLSNAKKHHKGDVANIYVNFSRNGTDLILTVEDDGPGIEPAYREKVFDVFSTLERRDSKEASGIGLAIVKKIVAQNNGTVEISDGEYGGAKFTIQFPADMKERDPKHVTG